MRKVYCIRHAITDAHVEAKKKSVLGFPDIGINEQGKKDAIDLAYKLQELKIQGIISSNMKSSIDTANIIADYLHIPLYYSDLLRERDQGEFTGIELQVLKNKYTNFSITTDGEGREKLSDFIKRSKVAFEQIVNDYTWDSCLIVSHKGLLQTMIATRVGLKPKNWYLCEMRMFYWDEKNNKWRIESK